MPNRLVLVVLLALSSAVAQTDLASRDWMNRGVEFFKNAQYPDAAAAFQHAIDLDPACVDPHLYLATALMAQFMPGMDSVENRDLAERAGAEFEAVLRLDPSNLTALESLASLAINESSGIRDPAERARKVDESAGWNRRIIELNPQAKEAYYSLGVLAWGKFYPALEAARAQLGMKPADPGPLTDINTRQDLRERFGAIIEDGIANLEKAIEIDPAYDDAMAYMNLLIRERADLRATAGAYQQDIQTADQWVQKALDAKKAKSASGAERPQGPPAGPSGGGGGGGGRVDPPQRIRVPEDVQSNKLIHKVDPVYPPLARQARIQGAVHFQAIIGKDGHLRNVQLISGHPLLVPAAKEAVKQWVYQPMLLDGEPIEVIAPVKVSFSLDQ